MIRKTVYYSGRVQGVFFRATARETARHYGVSGFARNLDDGRVEVIVEGPLDQVDAFLDDLEDRKRGNIEGIQLHQSQATREFSSFSIRYW